MKFGDHIDTQKRGEYPASLQVSSGQQHGFGMHFRMYQVGVCELFG